MASSKCSIDGCKRTSDTLCAHRQSQVCTKHYIEHVKEANQELASFSDDLNSLVDLCQQQQPPQRALEQLEQWRDENHRRIDQIYEEKLQPVVEEQMDEQLKRLRELSTQVKELIDEGDASFRQIKYIRKRVNEFGTRITLFRMALPSRYRQVRRSHRQQKRIPYSLGKVHSCLQPIKLD